MIDNETSKIIFGHYARILVDMNFSKKLFYEILVEQEGFSFPVEVVYEWIPEFCSHCQNLGHNFTSCRSLYPRKENKVPYENVDKGKSKVQSKKQDWVPLKVNTSGIGSSNCFAAPCCFPPLKTLQPILLVLCCKM